MKTLEANSTKSILMKHTLFFILAFLITSVCLAQVDSLIMPSDSSTQQKINKQIALDFYKNLWQTNNTDNYRKYVADPYVVHDIGDRKNVTEPAVEQKITADRFWGGGEMDLDIDWQIAEGDLVATRSTFHYKAESFMSKMMIGTCSIPIINVFRIRDGKIVEIWNHRHDIDTNVTQLYTIKGFFFGLLVSLIPIFFMIRYRRKLKQLTTN